MAINSNLPEVCYAYVDEIQQVVGILRGESGYRIPSNLPSHLAGDADASRAWVDNRNIAMDVTPAQREAMVAGSAFGWDLPIADPGKFPTAAHYTRPADSN
ncbi:hypothetical protein [Rhizobium sp. CECT 9324]|uniref:hypothetical protein n=1 Tax=Rhizobium sp. CECT 9324 TaxID=2845820 RepID=UPI001E4B01E5|nr:hypothetical protein [Rhizobium sp. CECT 9324]CAH0343684.1 hypothetical protein RHI9324_05421 [Rhizobium sp. CECT 9324]CAH0343703.1 hypothetical protein RHI9324_05440 [Rhizobium sp. CECT 9324]